MSENDYIAEYVREYYPELIGVEYKLWKAGKKLNNRMDEIIKSLRKAPWSKIANEIKTKEAPEAAVGKNEAH